MSDSTTRRLFLGGTLLVLGGCATNTGTSRSRVPGPIWTPPAQPTIPVPPAQMPATAGAMARSLWAKGRPIPTRMDRMTPIHRITIHHDGMSPFTATSMSAAKNRLESIRRAHLNRRPQPFGDIGYHYAIDPSGRIWSGRPTSWQGAHVRAQNKGNLGIVVLGNYDQQSLNAAQKNALVRFLGQQMKTYNIRSNKVATHQEMAATACPGKSLQAFMIGARKGRLA
ncbi:MAG: N-acetylmuramoyl-L-alanine amidase [Phycisphaerae bacterium]|nr:N-acetylmuramoyl-L-alanine amidase [Phycisphaerae bacterium]